MNTIGHPCLSMLQHETSSVEMKSGTAVALHSQHVHWGALGHRELQQVAATYVCILHHCPTAALFSERMLPATGAEAIQDSVQLL